MAKGKQLVNKGGRTPKPIDENIVYELAKMHCNNKEIAAVVGVSVDTIERRFAVLVDKGKEEGRATLRRLQWQQAMKGNIMMLIWLGKQLLGQKDKQPDEVAQVSYNVYTNEVPK